MIPTHEDNPQGFHLKYAISKLDGKELDPGAEYFVLRLDTNSGTSAHILACRKAIIAYANEIWKTKPEFAEDLLKRYPEL